MPTIYQPCNSQTLSVTVNAPTVTYGTTLSLAMSTSSVIPGDALTATAVLLSTQTGTPPVVGATVTLTITPEVGAAITQTAMTDSTGTAKFNLASLIATATATVGGFGAWTFVASFAGVTQ